MINSKKIVCLSIILVFLLPFVSTFLNFNSVESKEPDNNNLNTSATNYLYNNKSYDFHLDNFYDDDDLTNIYTGAEFQTEDFNEIDWSGTIDGDTISNVNNIETQYGDPANINMIKGTTDSADNMRVNDLAFTTFTSALYGTADTIAYESPMQFGDFDFTEGSGGAVGELETNDNNTARIDAGEDIGIESYLGYIVPESDMYTQWDEGDATPHWSKLDEAPGDMDGDDGNIRETTSGIRDGWYFTSLAIPVNFKVTKLIVWFLVKKQSITQATKLQYRTTGIINYIIPPSTDYMWIGDAIPNLLMSQADLDAFWIRVSPYLMGGEQGWIDIETVYVDVYKTDVTYSFWYEITWDVTNNPDTFYYDYRTTVAKDCDLDIWNWDTTSWLELESNTGTEYITGSYALTDPYISATNQVRVRFYTSWYGSMWYMELDQIALEYTIPGDLSNEIEATIKFPFINYDDILSMDVLSWQRTNTTQAISFSILDHDTGEYTQMSNSSDIAFTKNKYNIKSPEKYISLNEVVILRWTGVNTTDSFELHIDYLHIQIYSKLDLACSKTFDTNGVYRYRWLVLSSIGSDYTEWVEFEVIEPVYPDYTAIILAIIISSIILGLVVFGIGVIIIIQTRRGANKTTKASTHGEYTAFPSFKDSLKRFLKKLKK